jgi:hypothetical protein
MNYSRQQLEALGEPLGESVTQTKPGGYGRIYGGGGGSTNSTVTQSNIPNWMRPQVEGMLGAAGQELFNMDGDTITGIKQYTPYSTNMGDYFAGFNQDQQNVFDQARQMQTPNQFYQGSQYANMAGMGGLSSANQAYGYGGAGYGSGMQGQQYGTAGGGYYGGMGAGYGAQGADYGAQAAGMSPQAQMYGQAGYGSGMQGQQLGISGGGYYGGQAAGLAPQAQQYGQGAADIGMMGLRAEELGRDVGDEARYYARQTAGMGGTYERMATDPSNVAAYMSPYMQNVTDVAKQNAVENAKISNLGANLGAARQGTYGGARQLLAETQREAALGKQLNDIDVTGLQKAYEDAQRSQQFGATLGLQGLQGAQQGFNTALSGGQLGLSGIGQAISGQQAGIQGLNQAGNLYGIGLQGVGQQLAGTAQGMQGSQYGLAGLNQAGNLYGLGMQGSQMGMQGAQTGLQGIDRQLAGTYQGIQGAQTGLQGVSGAQSGYSLANQAGSNLANMGTQQQQADLARMLFQSQMGDQQQAFDQRHYDQAIQNYAMSQVYPQQQLAFYNSLLRGYATPTTTTTQYQAAPSPLGQLAGIGTAAAGAYGLATKRAGGKIEEQDDGGIDELMIRKTLKKVQK